MRSLIPLLTVYAFCLLPFIACMDAGAGEEGCDLPKCIGSSCPDPCKEIVCPPDDNKCTREYCAYGHCTSEPVTNGVPCTYGGVSGVCVEGLCGENLCEGVSCEDGDACTNGSCDYVDGLCRFVPVVCDDNPCSKATCEAHRGCIYAEVEDGTRCEGLRICQGGDCVAPCDLTSVQVHPCPIKGLEDQICCPGLEYCTNQNSCRPSACDPRSAEVYSCPIRGLEALVCCPRSSSCRDRCCRNAGDCDDGDPCTQDECADSVCGHSPSADGIACANEAGVCQAGNCVGTFACTEDGIRDAIAAGGGPHTFDCGAPTTVVTQATIEIDKNVVLDGEGNLTLDANGGHRVFWVETNVTAELQGVTITGGATGASGGAIWNYGTLTLTNSTVSGNAAQSGGGIRNSGVVTLANSTVAGNTAENYGGGILNIGGGSATLTNTTLSGNSAQSGGGASNKGGAVSLTNSTISGNVAEFGGAITNRKDPFRASVITLTRSVVDGDCETGVGATTGSNGYNVESPGDTCGFDEGTDLVNVSPDALKLGPLQNNGGPTMTHALLPGSVAIDKIPEADCVDADGAPLTTDQRGEPRPKTGGTMCDVGAFEAQP